LLKKKVAREDYNMPLPIDTCGLAE